MFKESYEVIDGETGEIITDQVKREYEKEEEKRKQSAEYFKEEEAKKALHDSSKLKEHEVNLNGFVWANFTPLTTFKEKYDGLKESHYARLMYMSTFLTHNSEQLKKDNGRPIKKKDIAGMIAASERATRDFISDVKKYNLLSFDDDNNVYIHDIFTKGRVTSRGYTHTRMYRKTVRSLYEMVDGRGAKKLGVIFNVIPFIDFRINVLCHNADKVVKDSSDLIVMTLEELAEKLGYKNAQKLKDTLFSFKIDGERLIHITHDTNNKSIIIVNPKFVYAGSYEDFESNSEFLQNFNALTGTSLYFNNRRLKE